MKGLTKEEFLKEASSFYDKITKELDSNVQDFYEYESKLDVLVNGFGKELLEKGLGEVPVDIRKKKKVQTRFGQIQINGEHRYSSAVNGYRISPYLQERLVLVGQSEVYSESANIVKQFLGIEVNGMQIQRLVNTYGGLSEHLVGEQESQSLKSELDADEVVYVEADGSMVFTREDKWSEVKVGRIFREQDILPLSTKRSEVRKSLYAAHLGGYEDFLNVFEPMVDVFDSLKSNLVFLTDGATWIRQWIDRAYPNALQILDFTHGTDHISSWLDMSIKDKEQKQQTFKEYKELLLEKGVEVLIEKIKQTPVKLKTLKEEQRKVLNYLNTNAYRMNYPQYIKQGLCIGSGAIEAAHRTVVQQRMKLSGQRWSKNGAQNMLNLKVAYRSGHWGKIVNLIRGVKIAA